MGKAEVLPTQLNILLIYVDQLRHDALRCAGNPDVITPNIDRLAARGVRFSRCFVQHPLCMPSRVSMLSGRYPSSLRILRMGVPVPTDTTILPGMLRNHGYYSANFGKLHFLPHANREHCDPHPAFGFDQLEVSDEPGPYADAYHAFVRQRMPDQLPFIRQVAYPEAAKQWRHVMDIDDPPPRPPAGDAFVPRAFPGREEATHAAFVSQRTCEFLDGRASASRPFLCIAGFYNPHPPLVTPQRFLDMYEPDRLRLAERPPEIAGKRREGFDDAALRAARHGYYAMVSELDEHVGRILGKLEATGLAERTVVVFTSDHGEFLGDHERWGKGYPAPDCISRVPLIVSLPGSRSAVESGIVEAVDIVPTLLELAGAPVPRQCQGRSLVDALSGRGFAGRDGTVVESEGWRTWRSETHRYVLHADGRERLFDLSAPWGEWRDIAADASQNAVLAEMRYRLAMHMTATAQTLDRVWPY